MGQPVVHFEIMGKDGEKLQSYYSQLFGWEIDANNPLNYGVVQRDGNLAPDGTGIGGGREPGRHAHDGTGDRDGRCRDRPLPGSRGQHRRRRKFRVLTVAAPWRGPREAGPLGSLG